MGDSPLAAEFRRLITAGAVPGWDLHPMPAGRTPLHVLAGPLHRLSGSSRFCNLLEREGFGYVEEVAVTPEGCLLEFRNSGPRFITAVRQVIADLGFGGAEARTGRLLAPGDAGPAGSASASSRSRHCSSLGVRPRTTGTVRSGGARHRQHSPIGYTPP